MNTVQQLWQTHQDIIKMAADGAEPSQCAKRVGMGVDYVTSFLSNRPAQDQVASVASVAKVGSDGR